MNLNAAFKTLLVVLGIGAVTGFNEWRHVYGGTPEEQASRKISACIKASNESIYKAHGGIASKAENDEQQRGQDACRQDVVAGVGPQYVATPAHKEPVVASSISTNSKRQIAGATVPKKEHYTASGQRMTQSREQCLGQLEEARKRSPGGLNPDWEKSERDRCQALYSDADQ